MHRRMVRMPNGDYEEFQLVVMRLNPENPKEVTLMLEDDVAELSKDNPQKNCFIFGFVSCLGLAQIREMED